MYNLPNNIVSCLLNHAATTPQATAFVVLQSDGAEKEISYSQLALMVEALVARLIKKQLTGKQVVLIYQHVPEFITAFLACQYLGIIAVPVPYVKGTKQIARLYSILKDAAVSAVFCTVNDIEYLQRSFNGFAAIPEIIITDESDLPRTLSLQEKEYENTVAFIQYTSGSTGKPKGVVITGSNLMHNQQLIANTFGCNNKSVIFTWLPFHHDMGLIGNLLHTIYTGCTCIVMSPYTFMQTPKKWLEGITRYKVTHSGGPNFAYDLCVEKVSRAELASLDLSSWRVVYNGSEPIRAESMLRFAEYFKQAKFKETAFYPCYGLAEATLLVSGSKQHESPLIIHINRNIITPGRIELTDIKDPSAQSIVSSGVVAAGMTVKIISPNDQHECDELEEGEICISGNSVTGGYRNSDNNGNFYSFSDGSYLRTGDLGFLYNGELFVHGRLKEMLIVRGANFYPADIEEMIAGCDATIETNGVAVFCVNDVEDRFVVVAEIKRTLLRNIDAASIISAIDKTVNGFLGINLYDIVLTTPWAIPRTTSGKLQRLKCKDHYLLNEFSIIESKLRLVNKMQSKEKSELLLSAVLKQADHNSIKKYLLNMIESKVGNLPEALISDQTELTEMGIDSLRAMEMINIINKELHINIEAATIFRENTLKGFITSVENMLWLNNKQTTGKEITI